MKRRKLRAVLLVLAALMLAVLGTSYAFARDFVTFRRPAYPADPLTSSLEESELSAHVHFLAHPALKGRRPLSMGSRAARRYIAERFRACGLKPWGNTQDYEQPFSLGTNVVGLLPGNDPAVDEEIVLITAHYDHNGRGRLGACDNASGVAALLETAEAFASVPQRPRRSVAFASFDCEEMGLIGAYAFTEREDVKRARIRAVLNIDMLGRRFLDLLDNAVIAVGSEYHPGARAAILNEADAAGIRAYPASLELVGPRSDHMPFVFGAAPQRPVVLFFSCGSFPGYHTKDDRAETLDYDLLTRSARVVCGTARRLADADAIEPPAAFLDVPDRAELDLFRAVGDQLLRNGSRMRLTDANRAACERWLRQAETCASDPSYSFAQRQDLVQLLPALGPPVRRLLTQALGCSDEPAPGMVPRDDAWFEKVIGSTEVWARYGAVFDEGYRGFVRQILERQALSLVLNGLPEHYSYDVPCAGPRDLILEELGDGQYRLAMFDANAWVTVVLNRFGQEWHHFNIWGQPLEWNGTRDELIDQCLLYWQMIQPDEARLRDALSQLPEPLSEEEIRLSVEATLDPLRVAANDRIGRLMLETVTGEQHGATLDEWIQWRLQQRGLPDREAWIAPLLESDDPGQNFLGLGWLQRADPERARTRRQALYRRILARPELRAQWGAAAAAGLAGEKGGGGLRELIDYLDDTTVMEIDPPFSDVESGPLKDHPVIRYGTSEAIDAPGMVLPKETKTLGGLILHNMKAITGKDFGTDKSAWLRLFDEGYTPPARIRWAHPVSRTPNSYRWSLDDLYYPPPVPEESIPDGDTGPAVAAEP